MTRLASVLLLALSCCGHPPFAPDVHAALAARRTSPESPSENCFWLELHVHVPFRIGSAELDADVITAFEDVMRYTIEQYPTGSSPSLRAQGHAAIECESAFRPLGDLAMRRALAVVALMERLGAAPGQVEARADAPLSLPPACDPDQCRHDAPYRNASVGLQAWVCRPRTDEPWCGAGPAPCLR